MKKKLKKQLKQYMDEDEVRKTIRQAIAGEMKDLNLHGIFINRVISDKAPEDQAIPYIKGFYANKFAEDQAKKNFITLVDDPLETPNIDPDKIQKFYDTAIDRKTESDNKIIPPMAGIVYDKEIHKNTTISAKRVLIGTPTGMGRSWIDLKIYDKCGVEIQSYTLNFLAAEFDVKATITTHFIPEYDCEKSNNIVSNDLVEIRS